jgi:hypothetical protein
MILLALLAFYSDIPKSDQQIPQEICDQLAGPLTYLGEGSQAVAFLTEDGKSVLKLFKATHQKPFKLKRLFGQKDKAQSAVKWKNKFEETTRRTALAYDELKEESALLYLHFEATEQALQITIKERSGKERTLALNQLPFVLQKKAILAPNYLSDLIAQGELKKAREAISSLKALFESRASKGISDPRQTLTTNYGFIDGKAVQIDVGKIEKEDQIDAASLQAKVDKWARKNFPSLF